MEQIQNPIEKTKDPLGKKVFISTYGCQMNVNDTERMYCLLDMINYSPALTATEADLIIINSCSVREKPVHKVRSEVGRYRNLKEKNSNLKIGVTGCVAQQEKKKLLKEIPLLDFVCGTDAIDLLPQVVTDVYKKQEKIVSAKFEHSKPYQIETLIKNYKVTAFVNITKGCDNFCTFCVVPFTRGRERSRLLKELIKDVNNLYKKGVKEVTLLGQNVNSYRSECGADFSDLLKTLCLETSMDRIRYTTSHPKDFNEKLVKVMAEFPKTLCDYIHLPVQSGNSEVLERMNRGYTRQDCLNQVKMIRSILPNVALSSDIIVGFPGETKKQFEDTLTLLDEIRYDSLFSFKYSPRPYTKAARFKDQISEEEKSERLYTLQKKQDQITFEITQSYKGKTVEVLVEKFDPVKKMSSGRSRENKLVHFSSERDLTGLIQNIKVTGNSSQALKGSVCL